MRGAFNVMKGKNDLVFVASEFRANIEKSNLPQEPGILFEFPAGCCSWATWMIGHFLKYELSYDISERQADRHSADGIDSHAWLVARGVIIDITSDQFVDSDERVIVNSRSLWHSTWNIINNTDVKRIETYDQLFNGTTLRPSGVYEMLAEGIREKLS